MIPGVALFSLGGLVFLLPAMQRAFDPRDVWERVEWAEADRRRHAAGRQTPEAAS